MVDILLTIQHNGVVYAPPVEEGIKIEWERTGTPGKLTFTVLKPLEGGLVLDEGDSVCFYYNNALVFLGYIFTLKHDKENRVDVTCYDQIRYLKNKYTYVFENKKASQIIQALCDDLGLSTGTMSDTQYVIPAIAEENISALDIVLKVLEETLMNTGNMYVFYDNAGKLELRNMATMVSTNLICETTAEDYNYSSSIDDETYNSVILYYKDENETIQLYTASSPSNIQRWGTLRYFEEVENATSAQNKANSLLKLYNKKTRDLTIKGAFGNIGVRAGTLIPVQLKLVDATINNYMVVEKVTHTFDKDHHYMDLTLDGAWEDNQGSIVTSSTNTTSNKQSGGAKATTHTVTITRIGGSSGGDLSIRYFDENNQLVTKMFSDMVRMSGRETSVKLTVPANTQCTIYINTKDGWYHRVESHTGNWSTSTGQVWTTTVNETSSFTIRWFK